MNLRAFTIFGLTAGVLAVSVFGSGQAHAFNLLLAAGSPQVRIVWLDNGDIRIVEAAETAPIKVSSIEKASAHKTFE